jgi:hypothetical protein
MFLEDFHKEIYKRFYQKIKSISINNYLFKNVGHCYYYNDQK